MATDELMELIRQWALERWPRRPVKSVTIKADDVKILEMPMPDVAYKSATPVPRISPSRSIPKSE